MRGNPDELVYAIDLGKWFLIGEYRSFVVENDGTVIELSDDVTTAPLTLDDFDLDVCYMPLCVACRQFDDWGHREICPGPSD